MKLTAAKCPSCGAAIEVNKNLEKTICQYCGTTVLVDDAIAKLKIELSGKVEVEGIETDKSKLDRARKHIRLKEYGEANRILSAMIAKNKLNEEAYLELLRMKLSALKDRHFTGKSSRSSDSLSWQLIDEILDIYKRIKKIDEDKSLEKELEKISPEIDKYRKMLEELGADNKQLEEATKIVDEVLNTSDDWSENREKNKEKMFEIVNRVFQLSPRIGSRYLHFSYEYGRSRSENYNYSRIRTIERDGSFSVSYYNRDAYPTSVVETHESELANITIDLLNEKANECLKERNAYFEKVNAKMQRKNRIRKFFYYTLTIAYILLIAIVVIAFISGNFITGILWALLIDSWAVPLLRDKASDIKREIVKVPKKKK